jgi:hypothetical protein
MPKKLTFAPLAAVVALLFAGGFAPLQAQGEGYNPLYSYYCDPTSCYEVQVGSSVSVFLSINAECLNGNDLAVWAGAIIPGLRAPGGDVCAGV